MTLARMTVTSMGLNETLTTRVAAEIRGLLGKRRMSQAQLARQLGQSQMWVSDRLRAVQPLDLNDLERIADVLGVRPIDLLQAAESGTTLRYQSSLTKGPIASRPPTYPSDRRAPTGPVRQARPLSHPSAN